MDWSDMTTGGYPPCPKRKISIRAHPSSVHDALRGGHIGPALRWGPSFSCEGGPVVPPIWSMRPIPRRGRPMCRPPRPFHPDSFSGRTHRSAPTLPPVVSSHGRTRRAAPTLWPVVFLWGRTCVSAPKKPGPGRLGPISAPRPYARFGRNEPEPKRMLLDP